MAKAPTKSEVYGNIATATELSKKQIAGVFEALAAEIGKAIGSEGPGQFTIPGLCKIVVQNKPAVPERMGVNPFTGQEQMFKAKPARNVVKVRPLKGLKDMA